MLKSIIFSGVLLCISSGLALAQQASLTVNVTNFRNAKGVAHYWLYNSADGFPGDAAKAIRSVDAPITGTTSRCVFENLPVGTYAVTAIHDENGNHQFDTNFMGISKEAYGTSNDVRGGITGPPRFDKASFLLAKTGTTITFSVK